MGLDLIMRKRGSQGTETALIRQSVTAVLGSILFLVAITVSLDGAMADTLLPGIERVREGERLAFAIDDGGMRNIFLRQGPVAAHLVASGGKRPRVIVAFPAGDSGTGLWLDAADQAVWTRISELRPVRLHQADGSMLYGVTADLEAAADGELTVQQVVLGSIRVLRDYQNGGQLPGGMIVAWRRQGDAVVWHRQRLDGQPGYLLALQPLQGKLITRGRAVRLRPTQGRLILRVAALTGERPLTPIPQTRILRQQAVNADPSLFQALAFLSYREKLLAGSWRFLTYFGRDTLLSLFLLMPVISPDVAEAGLAAVIARLSPRGEVAHEEEIGEFAVLHHLARDGQATDAPIYDTKMIDDDFLLVPVLLRYLRMVSVRRGATFLARQTAKGERYADAVRRQIAFVLARARPFAAKPTVDRLIALKPGQGVGNWRDSLEGLGGGRYPYDVNVVFVPLALEAAAKLLEGSWLPAQPQDSQLADEARRLAAVWEKRAPPLFAVTVPAVHACMAVKVYAQRLGVPFTGCRKRTGGLQIAALALDEKGAGIPVLHSDTGFRLLFRMPPEAEILAILDSVLRPFPTGLLTPVGMIVANPVYASTQEKELFTRRHYHGMVVWSWQQAVMAAGLARQLTREDLSPSTRSKLLAAHQAVWAAISAARVQRAAELWSWAYEGGRYRIVPFRPAEGHTSEANAIQLWSTVFLALHPAGSFAMKPDSHSH
ncbi:MAG: hypothetical protein D6791_07565 [Chloroflexi bacterium]|nr:MAG: hypothetical protein D6791_07565 [Chloroflexota bacterium]